MGIMAPVGGGQDGFLFYFMVTSLKVFKGNVIESVLVSEVTEF